MVADTGVGGLFATPHRNVSIAYNTIIENANGGSARDYLVRQRRRQQAERQWRQRRAGRLSATTSYTGGAGADEFRFSEIGGNDKITDFASGADRIRLTEIDANSGVAGNQAFTFIGNAAFSDAAGQLRSYSQGGENYPRRRRERRRPRRLHDQHRQRQRPVVADFFL